MTASDLNTANQTTTPEAPQWSRIRQLAFRGKRWIGIRYNRVEAKLYDLRHRTDTGGKVMADGLDIPDDIATHVTGFQSVNERQLRAVLGALDFPPDSTFVDVGCGKGKALLVAARFPFVTRLLGLELSPSLCAVAGRNVEIARARGTLSVPIEIIAGDALAYSLERGENIFFLNNPFDTELMKRFVDGLQRSVARQPRTIWMLYYNPVHTEMVVADGRLKLVREFEFFGPGRNLNVFQF